ncbi:uncharacterized protein SPSK_08178 [Sporothrix schenckii 1099-18]|uniref:Uncharacterized protein n=1 Tax=Sporothrix schenckii 1099-18 TaxID=1397361 RepID=A0A0F2ME82_SPOSC|nr:uncharacterized protein SPSK_08178 [Sporothrix schenckii 1099-18]KJR87978.1 hypothetical protein SPSK_08178 [Sporothrix schenckii 1099-18]
MRWAEFQSLAPSATRPAWQAFAVPVPPSSPLLLCVLGRPRRSDLCRSSLCEDKQHTVVAVECKCLKPPEKKRQDTSYTQYALCAWHAASPWVRTKTA